MITKTEVRKGKLGNKKGWCFDVYYQNNPYPNFISALFKTRKETKQELTRYLKTGDYRIYGSAE